MLGASTAGTQHSIYNPVKEQKMKKIFLMLCALGCGATVMAQSSEVTIKKGTAKMDEAYYYQLKQKANAYDQLE